MKLHTLAVVPPRLVCPLSAQPGVITVGSHVAVSFPRLKIAPDDVCAHSRRSSFEFFSSSLEPLID